MQNTPIFVRKNHEKFGEFTIISYLCKRNTKTRQNTASAVKHIGENNKFNLIENYVQFSKKIEVYR